MRTETKRSAAASAANEQWKLSAYCVGRAKFAKAFTLFCTWLSLTITYSGSLCRSLSVFSHSCFADFAQYILIYMANLFRLALGNGLPPSPSNLSLFLVMLLRC